MGINRIFSLVAIIMAVTLLQDKTGLKTALAIGLFVWVLLPQYSNESKVLKKNKSEDNSSR
jgi:hypothetical protein